MSDPRRSTTLARPRTSPTRRRVRRRLIAVVAAVGLLGPALSASPAIASSGQVTLQSIVNSSEFLGSVFVGTESTTPVTYRVFAAAGDGLDPVAEATAAGFGGVTIPLADGAYRISATAPGFLTSWYTSTDGGSEEQWSELIGYHQIADFAAADVITVDASAPANSTWSSPALTVLYEHATSITGGVVRDLDFSTPSLAAGVTVELYAAAAVPDSDPVATVATDANGYYSFVPVPGSYKIRFEATVNNVPVTQWWPVTANRGEAETIVLANGTSFPLAYGVFQDSIPVDPARQLTLSGNPAVGATLTAVPDYVETTALGGACLQRYAWLIDGVRVPEAFGNTFVVPASAAAKTVTARLDIVGLGCNSTALASNPIGPIAATAGFTETGTGVSVSPDVPAGTPPITLTFGHVTTPGITTVTTSTAGPSPTGFSLQTTPALFYFLDTTAAFDPAQEVEVCIDFDASGMTTDQASQQHLYHFVDNAWTDITTTTGVGRVCGSTSSFSPFAIGRPSWPFRGFLRPIDNGATLNLMKAGAAVPVKFGLDGPRGLGILARNSPASTAVSCGTTSPVDVVELTVAAGASSLSYDPTSDIYTYVWKTEKQWAGTCRQFVMTLADGTVHRALFKFK
ncbi:MAG: PxKF domain-containing protein [Cryobacterium sp.]